MADEGKQGDQQQQQQGDGNQQQSQGNEGAKTRPEFLPEDFWDNEKGEAKLEDLAKNYGDLKKKVTTRNDDFKKQVKEEFEKERFANRPESIDKYELRVPEGVLPEGVEWEFNDNDPLVAFARNFAFENGMGQEGFDGLVAKYMESEIQKLPDVEAEVKRLGEKGKERMERVDNWLQVNVSKGAYAALSAASTKAEMVIAIEELMAKAGAPVFVIHDGPGGDGEVLTDALVRSWQADPKYWDPTKRDQAHIDKVEKAWKKLYPTKK